MNKPYQAYQNNAVNTATGGELTLMLYNGCLKFLNEAKRNMEANDFEKKNTHIQKAQAIIRELMITLDPEVPLTEQMMPLYDYMLNQLQQANIENEPAFIDEVIGFVTEFRDTWKQVILKTRKQNHPQGVEI